MSQRTRALVVLACILGAACAIRLVHLRADAPWWEEASIADSGHWADGARGKVLFGDYFADDLGGAYLVTPGYTWVLEVFYRLGGVRLVTTRLPSSLTNIGIVLLAAGLMWACAGRRAAIFASALLAISPLFWTHGRVGLQESMQTFAITGSCALWFVGRRRPALAMLSGFIMAAAVAIKPNSLQLGLIPLASAGVVTHLAASAKLEEPEWARERALFLRSVLAALAGLAAGMSLLLVIHIIPNWDRFWPMFRSESGMGARDWRAKMRLPGIMMVSRVLTGDGWRSILWQPARFSPALMILLWLILLGIALDLRRGWRAWIRSMGEIETFCVIWLLTTLALIWSLDHQPARRYVLLFPSLAMAGACFLKRRLDRGLGHEPSANEPRRLADYARSILTWLILTAPLMVVAKPRLANFLIGSGAELPIGDSAGIGWYAAQAIVAVLWIGAALALGALKKSGLALAHFAMRYGLVACLPVALAFEVWITGEFFLDLETNLYEAQQTLENRIEPGEIVLGYEAATLCSPLKVRTVRLVMPGDRVSQPVPNPDAWSRLKPRYVIEMTRNNFTVEVLPRFPEILERDYEKAMTFEAGPTRKGVVRYAFTLYESKASLSPGGEQPSP